MNILVACEESQEVCMAFRNRGHNAYSCDIMECSGGHPEYHICGDVFSVLNGGYFKTSDGCDHYIEKWDMLIAFPPCTYLTVTGNRWYNIEKYGEKAIQRRILREKAKIFFLRLVNANIEKICVENPVGVMNTYWKKPSQIIQPYFFGEPYEKRTCLWLYNLPLLKPTCIVQPTPRVRFKSGKSMPGWYADLWKKPSIERAKIRSKTFHGVALAMAEQWG